MRSTAALLCLLALSSAASAAPTYANRKLQSAATMPAGEEQAPFMLRSMEVPSGEGAPIILLSKDGDPSDATAVPVDASTDADASHQTRRLQGPIIGGAIGAVEGGLVGGLVGMPRVGAAIGATTGVAAGMAQNAAITGAVLNNQYAANTQPQVVYVQQPAPSPSG